MRNLSWRGCICNTSREGEEHGIVLYLLFNEKWLKDLNLFM